MSENLSLRFLNELYDLKLENTNYNKRNTPSVDLIDNENHVAFQITSRTDSKKIKDSIQKFVDNKLDLKYTNGIRFLILNFESVKKGRYKYTDIYANFDFDKHVITDKQIISDIEKLSLSDKERFHKILNLFNESIANTDVPDDEYILKEIVQCFDRPAFTTPFHMESNLPHFVKAIEDTIAAINTGIYRMRDGTLIKNITPKSSISNQDLRIALDKVIYNLIDLRYTYEKLIDDGEIKLCGCNQPDCGVHCSSHKASNIMNDKRKHIFNELHKLLPDFRISIYY